MASVTVRRSDLYRVLGVTRTATPDEITAAFRAQAKILHPDRNPGDHHAAEQFKVLTLAYQTLIRPRARAAYDERHQPVPHPPMTPAPPAAHRAPLFRTSGRARAAVAAGITLLVTGVAVAALLVVLDTGDTGETVTLWIAAAKLLIGGPVLAAAGVHRLRTLATGR